MVGRTTHRNGVAWATAALAALAAYEARKKGKRRRGRPRKPGLWSELLADARKRKPGRPTVYTDEDLAWLRDRVERIQGEYKALDDRERQVFRRGADRALAATIAQQLGSSLAEVLACRKRMADKLVLDDVPEAARPDYLRWLARHLKKSRWRMSDSAALYASGVSAYLAPNAERPGRFAGGFPFEGALRTMGRHLAAHKQMLSRAKRRRGSRVN